MNTDVVFDMVLNRDIQGSKSEQEASRSPHWKSAKQLVECRSKAQTDAGKNEWRNSQGPAGPPAHGHLQLLSFTVEFQISPPWLCLFRNSFDHLNPLPETNKPLSTYVLLLSLMLYFFLFLYDYSCWNPQENIWVLRADFLFSPGLLAYYIGTLYNLQ